MFNDYYIFNKEVDSELKGLGFELSKDALKYEKVCQEDSLVVKYTITKKYVSAKRLYIDSGFNSYEFINELEYITLGGILDKAKKSLNDLSNEYSKIIENCSWDEACESAFKCNTLRRIEVNSQTMNSFKEVSIPAIEKTRMYGYVKDYTGIPVHLNDDLQYNSIKIYY